MRLFRNTRALVLLWLLVLILIVMIPLIVFLLLAQQKVHLPGRLTPAPRISQTPGGATSWSDISRNVPVFTSSASEPASERQVVMKEPQEKYKHLNRLVYNDWRIHSSMQMLEYNILQWFVARACHTRSDLRVVCGRFQRNRVCVNTEGQWLHA